MKHRFIFSFTLGLVIFTGCSPVSNQAPAESLNPEITANEILDHIKFLSDDKREGRFPGSNGSQEAIEYIVNHFKKDGLEPAGSNGFLQPFEFIVGIDYGEVNQLEIAGTTYEKGIDYIPLEFSSSSTVESDIVFSGYGFSIDDSVQWNDYANSDVEGKWVLVFIDGPDSDSPHSDFAKHTPLRKKAMLARDNNAAGILFVNKAGDDDKLIPLKHSPNSTAVGISVLHISRSIADGLVGGRLEILQKELDEKLAPNSFPISQRVNAEVSLKKEIVEVPNVLGMIRGSDSVLKDEYIVIGAHFDHLGYGGSGSGSLAPDSAVVHNGADDNASGTAGILELAEKLSFNKKLLKRSIILMAYNAEEEGLLGSKYYVNNPTIDLSSVIAMINMDMIGRMSDNKVTIGGTGTSPGFETLLNDVNEKNEMQLKMSPEGYGPSDHASFYINDVPVLFFFTGTHENYHKPSDDWEHINAKGEKQIVDLVYDLTIKLSSLDEKPAFTEAGPKEPTQTRRSFKVTFGVIPSYGSQEEGMEIDGAKKEGPAGKAGMKKGDVIIEIGGKEIKNIYDYMYRLGELNPGDEVDVKIKRGEKVLSLKVTL